LVFNPIFFCQKYDVLKDYEPGHSITYLFTRDAYPSSFIFDTTSTINVFNGTFRTYIDTISFNLVDSIKTYQLTIHKVGTEIYQNPVRIIWSRSIDTLYSRTISEHTNQHFNSGFNKIYGWLFPDTVYQSPRCPYDSTIFYPYNYYYRFYEFPSVDTFDLRGDTLVLTNTLTDCFDISSTNQFIITKSEGLIKRTHRVYNFFDWSFADVYRKDEVSGIKTKEAFPNNFILYQNHPNPFNPITIIKYKVPEFSYLTIKVYDVLGNEIASLVNEEKPAGSYEVEFNGTTFPSGIYFYQLQLGNFWDTKKMVLIK